jgi:hypothetical protein
MEAPLRALRQGQGLGYFGRYVRASSYLQFGFFIAESAAKALWLTP